MKKWKMLILLIISFIIIPTSCWAEIYVGAYIGPNFSGNINPNFEFYEGHLPPGHIDPNRYIAFGRSASDVKVDPSVIFGGKFGYWFTKESLFGLKLPTSLKHFGFELDISYQGLNWPSQQVSISPINQKYDLQNKGNAITASFLFMFRLGFLPDQAVPFGRLQPYLGIGPMLFISNTKLNIGQDFRSTEADLGLTIEPGIRYMVSKHISVNFAVRYRYVQSHVDVDDVIFDAPRHYIVMRQTYNMVDIILGTAYHF